MGDVGLATLLAGQEAGGGEAKAAVGTLAWAGGGGVQGWGMLVWEGWGRVEGVGTQVGTGGGGALAVQQVAGGPSVQL